MYNIVEAVWVLGGDLGIGMKRNLDSRSSMQSDLFSNIQHTVINLIQSPNRIYTVTAQ
jgi:hypothetical protein